MGCDIHGRLQRRWKEGGIYEDVGGIEDDRNYRVFAMLAGVRNGYGFAGIATHTPLVPVAEPRGLPVPLYRGTKWDGEKHVPVPYDDDGDDGDDGIWFGDHSFSWLTLSEILAWDGWDKPLECGEQAPEPFREHAKTFRAWLEWLRLKHGWQLEKDPAAVRIVFGFDS